MISWNLLYDIFFFCNFIELWTLRLDDDIELIEIFWIFVI